MKLYDLEYDHETARLFVDVVRWMLPVMKNSDAGFVGGAAFRLWSQCFTVHYDSVLEKIPWRDVDIYCSEKDTYNMLIQHAHCAPERIYHVLDISLWSNMEENYKIETYDAIKFYLPNKTAFIEDIYRCPFRDFEYWREKQIIRSIRFILYKLITHGENSYTLRSFVKSHIGNDIEIIINSIQLKLGN